MFQILRTTVLIGLRFLGLLDEGNGIARAFRVSPPDVIDPCQNKANNPRPAVNDTGV